MGQQFRRCSVRFMLRLPSLQASWATNLDARAPGCRDLLPPGFRFASHLLEAPDNATGASRAIPRVGLAPTGCMALRAAPQTLLDYPDHTATLRALATEHHLPWREHHEPAPSDILDCAVQFYAGRLTAPVLRYLARRGFPETFVRQRRIGYAPVSSTCDFLVRQIRERPGRTGPSSSWRPSRPGSTVGRSSYHLGTLSRRFSRRRSPCGGRQLPGGLVPTRAGLSRAGRCELTRTHPCLGPPPFLGASLSGYSQTGASPSYCQSWHKSTFTMFSRDRMPTHSDH